MFHTQPSPLFMSSKLFVFHHIFSNLQFPKPYCIRFSGPESLHLDPKIPDGIYPVLLHFLLRKTFWPLQILGIHTDMSLFLACQLCICFGSMVCAICLPCGPCMFLQGSSPCAFFFFLHFKSVPLWDIWRTSCFTEQLALFFNHDKVS